MLHSIQLFRERLSEKVHATIPKGIVGDFEVTVLQRKSSATFLNQKTSKQTTHEKQKTLDSSFILFCTSRGKRQLKTSQVDTKLCQLQLSK